MLGLTLAMVGCGAGALDEPTRPPVEDVRAAPRPDRAPRPDPLVADPFAGTDWDAVARAAHAYEERGQRREVSDGAYERLLAPVELPRPAACAPTPRRGIPRVHRRPTTVGPDPNFPHAIVSRVLRRDPGFAACAGDCTASTDVFEIEVKADGHPARVRHRARVGGSDARTACLTSLLERIALPRPRVAPFAVIVPVRLMPHRRPGPDP